jgi:capsular exopolysaccharide synthesis family protein
MEPTNRPFATTGSPFPTTGAPFGSTRVPFGATGAPFGVTGAPFGATGAPFPPPGGGRPPAAGDDFSFKELLDLFNHALLIIRSKWYWGLLGAVLVATPVGYYFFRRPVEYIAETDLLAKSTLDQVINTNTDSTSTSDEEHENDLRNHLSMMTSRRLRTKLAASFTPAEKALIAGPYLKPGAKYDDDFFQDYFDEKIDIERERGREYYAITVSHPVPEIAMMVADRMASEYLDYVQEQYQDANVEGYALLEKQAEAIRADIARIETASLDFRKKNGIISRTDNQSILTDRLKLIDADLTDIRVKRNALETQTKQAEADWAKSKFPWNNSYLASYGNNELLRQTLDQQLAERAELATCYGPNHPKMKDINSQIAGIQSSIQRNFEVAVRDLEAQLSEAKENETLLTNEFNDAFNSSIETEKLASTYEILSAGVDSKMITLTELEKKIGEASVSSQLPADFMQIVDPAYMVKRRIPKRVLYGVVVLFLAFGAFVTTPLVASALDERVSGTSDVEKVLGLGLAGAIPNLKIRPEERAHVVRNKMDLVIAESFVGIVGHLQVGLTQLYPMVVAVTSALPGEGKSLVASNLASTFRQLGKKTVLVDLDLRRPVQHTLHGVPDEAGFLTWARAGFPVENLLNPTGPLGIRTLVDGTDLICAGGNEPQPSQFLVSSSMDIFVGTLKGAYDVVILDTPPGGVFQDGLMIGRHADARLLVARENVAPVVQVKQVIDDFVKAGLPFKGLVLNGFVPANANKKLAYGYKSASKGYSYDKPKKTKKSNMVPGGVPKLAPSKT